jgi:hypothetical protein
LADSRFVPPIDLLTFLSIIVGLSSAFKMVASQLSIEIPFYLVPRSRKKNLSKDSIRDVTYGQDCWPRQQKMNLLKSVSLHSCGGLIGFEISDEEEFGTRILNADCFRISSQWDTSVQFPPGSMFPCRIPGGFCQRKVLHITAEEIACISMRLLPVAEAAYLASSHISTHTTLYIV